MALADILQIIQQQDIREERKKERAQDMALSMMQLDISQKRFEQTQEYETSKIYLTHNLEKLERLQGELSGLQNQSMELGLVGDKLTGQPEGISPGATDVFNTTAGSLDDDIIALQGQIKKEKTDQRHYFAGINYARLMDEDISGVVSETEFTEFMADSTQYPEQLKDSPAFYYGTQAYTLTPEKRVALEAARTQDELAKVALEAEELKLSFLPQSLKDEEALKKQQLDTGGVNLSILKEQVKQAKSATKVAETEVSLLNLRKDAAILAFEKEEYEFDTKMRAEHIRSIDEMLINNIQAQSGIGAGLLSGMSLELKDGVYTPMFSVLAGTVEQDYLGQISDASNLNFIAEDVQNLYSAYALGKSEDQVPDYSFVLNQVEDIVELKSLHSNFVREFNDELEIAANKMNRGKYSIEVLERVAMTKDPDKYDMKRLMKAIQWNNTGIYDNMEVLDQALKAKQQYQDLSSMQEQARGLDVSYNIQQYGTHQRTAQETMIPFTTRTDYVTPADTSDADLDDTILDIFNQNIR